MLPKMKAHQYHVISFMNTDQSVSDIEPREDQKSRRLNTSMLSTDSFPTGGSIAPIDEMLAMESIGHFLAYMNGTVKLVACLLLVPKGGPKLATQRV